MKTIHLTVAALLCALVLIAKPVMADSDVIHFENSDLKSSCSQ